VLRVAVPRLYIESDEPETTENRREIEWGVRRDVIPSQVDENDDDDQERFTSLKDDCRDEAAAKVCVPYYSILYVSEVQIQKHKHAVQRKIVQHKDSQENGDNIVDIVWEARIKECK
jgi:hypothetical protein